VKTLAQIYESYQSPASWGDKGTVHSYIEVYERMLASYRFRPGVKVLEIGLMNGASMQMWEEFFTNGTVYGIDLNDHPLDMVDLSPMIAEGTHHITLIDATNPVLVNQHFGGMKFDVIIEDASHLLEHQFSIYENFKDKLNPGALYVIEDIENIDATRERFEQIDPAKHVTIIDRRGVKGRFDDVLVVIEDKYEAPYP
jgi:SAM-dependent methyltransferase